MLDLIYPPVCAVCARFLYVTESNVCMGCRRELQGIMVPDAPDDTPRAALAPFVGTVRDAILGLKFRADLWRAPPLGQALAAYALALGWNVDAVVPVPLSRRRQWRRGYNQAHLLAQPLARALHATLMPSVLRRIRHTSPQASRDATERADIAGAFAATVPDVTDRRVLLVDDVTTTGHTVSACAGPLRARGAAWVGAISVAHATLCSDAVT